MYNLYNIIIFSCQIKLFISVSVLTPKMPIYLIKNGLRTKTLKIEMLDKIKAHLDLKLKILLKIDFYNFLNEICSLNDELLIWRICIGNCILIESFVLDCIM